MTGNHKASRAMRKLDGRLQSFESDEEDWRAKRNKDVVWMEMTKLHRPLAPLVGDEEER